MSRSLLALAPSARAQLNYLSDFQGTVGPEWSSTSTVDVQASSNRIGLDRFLNGPVTLTLSGFRPGVAATLGLDFYCLVSWDGSQSGFGPDYFAVSAGGQRMFDATFSNLDEGGFPQSYSPATPLGGGAFPSYTGADERDTLDYGTTEGVYYGNSVYRFGGPNNPAFSFVPSSSTVVFSFAGRGLLNLDDESWAIDNVRVTQPVSEPTAVTTLGVAAVAMFRRRKACSSSVHLRS